MTDAEGFTAGSMSAANADVFATALDRQAEMDLIRDLREWCRSRLGLRPGATAVDVGCGTGAELLELARLVQPGGRAIGVDANQPMLAIARHRSSGIPGVEVVAGEASELGRLESGSVDAIVCERVVQHLTYDPVRAFREFARVLAPAGVLAVTDTDWSSARLVVRGDEAATEYLRELREKLPVRPLANQLAGLKLEEYCVAAGLEVVARRTGTLGNLAAALLQGARDGILALAAAHLTPGERDEAARTLNAVLDDGRLELTVDLYAVLARRPLAHS
ncbi:methyltransferase domain-containing protein [Tsukamurella soli]|uniref:Methyltransferase type 11 domain-containing protein n=1 Tax=Tsukamurella soli TaxID=644556 RepID=A0ABP8JQJ5_9ACTN